MLTRLMILTGLVAMMLANASAAQADRRVALVVGNSAYASTASLRNPRNDASDMAQTLKKLGFEVEVGLDLDQQNFAVAIEKFARALDGADVGLFFYAGHGLQLNDKNYLVSINAKLENEFLMSSETIDLTSIVRLMESKAAVNLVFLDACRNNPLAENLRRGLEVTKRSANLGRGLARIEPASRDTLIAFAAAPGQVAADGDDRNSPFTASLLKNIPRPAVEVSVMLKEVSADVRRVTNNSQRPQQLSDMSRTFYFAAASPVVASDASAPEQVAKAPAPAGPPVAQQMDDRAFDVAFWNAAQTANDCDAVRAYLQRFPNGIFVELGKLSERRLCGAQRKVNVAEPTDRQEMAAIPLTPASPPVVPAQPALSSVASMPGTIAAPTSEPTRPAGGAVVAALPEPVTAAPPAIRATGPSSQDLARTVQLELYRLGCGPSSADGKWNGVTREGLRRFSRAARVKLDLEAPSNAAIAALQKQNGRVCPLECGRGMQAHGDTCVAVRHEPPPRSRKADRPQRRRHEAVETVAAPPPPMMMGPYGGGFGGGGMMFFGGMGRRH
jgi:uncharacterized caspase-like protein